MVPAERTKTDALEMTTLTQAEAGALLASIVRDGEYRGTHSDWERAMAKLRAVADGVSDE